MKKAAIKSNKIKTVSVKSNNGNSIYLFKKGATKKELIREGAKDFAVRFEKVMKQLANG